MDSVRLRQLVVAGLLPATAGTAIYGLASGRPNAAAASAALLGIPVLVGSVVAAARRYDPHQIALVQEKSYRITLRSVLATTCLTGIVLLGALYAAAAVIGAVTAFWGYETLSFRIFADAVARLRLLLDVPAGQLVAGYAVTAVGAAVSFWVLYPYLPTQDEGLAGPVAFVAAWLYLLSAASLFVPLPVGEPASLALDAAIIGMWGHVFALAYEDVERYVP
ncbi:MAG: hypothetical protein SVU88_03040 [Candidatus Nanohaloarchaea archaeon]|nr:hypothetical protein [Candidatus Nanohaloarchaea archaeon]